MNDYDIALGIVERWYNEHRPTDSLTTYFVPAIAAALQKCVAQERERCAAIVRDSESELWAAGTDQSFIDGYKAAIAGIYAAIRS